MKAEYEAIVTLIPVFSDQRYSQINPNYIKILLDEEEQILKKSIGYLHKDIKHCLSELFNEYIKVDYEWPEKTLVNCRKNKKTIEFTYLTTMPYISGSQRKGNIVNITEFSKIISDKYYAESIAGNAVQFR
jgi:pyruvate-formate lyase-activating enzyme